MDKQNKKYYTESETRIALAIWKFIFAGTLDKTSVTQICREAGVSRDTFYRHFSNPRQAIADVTLRYQKEAISRNADETGGDFSAFLERLLTEMDENGFYRTYLNPLLEMGLREPMLTTLAEALEEQGFFFPVTDGGFQPYEQHILIRAFCSAFLDTILYCIADERGINRADMHRYIMMLYNRILMPCPVESLRPEGG